VSGAWEELVAIVMGNFSKLLVITKPCSYV